jgi:hypothetical protein
MRASVDADGCCTRVLARHVLPSASCPWPAPASCHVPVGLLCAVPALLCSALLCSGFALICFDLIWSSLCHHQPSPDSRSFLWEVIRGTNHTSPQTQNRGTESPPPPPPLLDPAAWSHAQGEITRAPTGSERTRAGSEGGRASRYFVAAAYCPTLTEREMATARSRSCVACWTGCRSVACS